MRSAHAIGFMLSLAVVMGAAGQDTVAAFARIRGQSDSVLQGLGLVVGLNGTGDSAQDLSVARPLAEMLRRLGNPIASFQDLQEGRSAALVMVTCTVPDAGAAQGDKLDVTISTMRSASSLAGGILLTSPLLGPRPNDPTVYAFAQGPLRLEDEAHPTVAAVAGGGRMAVDVRTTPEITDQFDLILKPPYVGWSAANYLANQIEDEYTLTVEPGADPVTFVLDERTVRVRVPEPERPNIAAFVAQVMQTSVSSDLLGLPARVIANTRTGVIVVDGEVEISPAAITQANLSITTIVPPPIATPEVPLVETGRWTRFDAAGGGQALGQIDDLLASFNRLDVPTKDQIEILRALHRAGKLHAKLIIDGVEQ